MPTIWHRPLAASGRLDPVGRRAAILRLRVQDARGQGAFRAGRAGQCWCGGAFYLTPAAEAIQQHRDEGCDPVRGQARDDLLVAADDLAGLGLQDGQRAC